MFKLKKRPIKGEKPPELYNILENYTDFDPPGNVMVCAMAGPENLEFHAKILAESYDIPLEVMARLLTTGGVYLFAQTGGLITRGLFACKVDPTGQTPKQTWVLDLVQFAEAQQLAVSAGISLEEAAERVFYRTLPPELQERLRQKNLGLDEKTLNSQIAKRGDITYIDFRKDWSPHFKRKCLMPDGTLIETGSLKEFAHVHSITPEQAETLLREGGILELGGGEVLACQIINNQPTVARFNARQYAKAKDIAAAQGLHIMDALSEMAFRDPVLGRTIRQSLPAD
ncbi:MAG: hypothetical protein D6704_01785 [Nitrospirae bacterium]|nr:MAG: hypothetical protein D6704_01785 [Nitrospirota bacterium]